MASGSIVKTFKDTFFAATGLNLPSNTHATVGEFGLDSLDALNIMHEFETKYGVLFTKDNELRSTLTFCDVFKLLLDTLVASKKITKGEADCEYTVFAMSSPAKSTNAVVKKEPTVSIPKSLLDECIRVLSHNTQLVSQLKQYQK